MNDDANTGTGGDRGPRTLRWTGALAAAAAVALLTAACGTGSPAHEDPATAAPAAHAAVTEPPATEQTAYQQALAYARCMRTHGEPTWPAPTSDGNFDGNLDLSSDHYLSANQSCVHLLPNDRTLAAAQARHALGQIKNYAACMRSHGVTRFSDDGPWNAQAGEARLWHYSRHGLHTTWQQFNSAYRACRRFLPSVAGTS
jgi:hypothetical protein